jgi:hypothetical protein
MSRATETALTAQSPTDRPTGFGLKNWYKKITPVRFSEVIVLKKRPTDKGISRAFSGVIQAFLGIKNDPVWGKSSTLGLAKRRCDTKGEKT